MRRVKYLPWINPLLAAAFPVVFLYSNNSAEASFSTVALMMLVFLLGAALFTVIVRILVRDYVKAGFIAAIWLLLFFSAGNIFEIVAHKSIRLLVGISVVTDTCFQHIWPFICWLYGCHCGTGTSLRS